MGFKPDPKRPGKFIVFYSKRHPITRQTTSLRRLAPTEAAARRLEKTLVVEVEKKLHRKIVPTWPKAVEQHLEACRLRGLTAKTVEDYGLALRAHTYEAWADRTVDSITTQEIRELTATRSAGRPSHEKSLLKFIRGVFTYALEAGYVNRNPTPASRFKMPDKIRRVLTEPQAHLLLQRAKEMDCEWYPHWVMALYTGMRSGELYALTWDKVNFDTEQITVNCSWNSTDGLKSTKSGDDRIVDVAPTLMTMLRQWKLERQDSIYVLPRLKRWDLGEQACELRLFLMGLRIAPVRFHDLRATWATMMLSKGVEPIKVMSMGGWKDLKTLMIYTRKAGVDIKGVAGCLNELHDPSTKGAKVLKLESRGDSWLPEK